MLLLLFRGGRLLARARARPERVSNASARLSQALVHYHIGKTGDLGISLPGNEELFKIVVSIIICSGLASATTTLIEQLLERRKGGKKD